MLAKWLAAKTRRDMTALLRDGRRLQCQLADRTQRTMYFGLFEPRETRLLAELLNSGDTFIDVGAHIGWFTTVAARYVGGAARSLPASPTHLMRPCLRGIWRGIIARTFVWWKRPLAVDRVRLRWRKLVKIAAESRLSIGPGMVESRSR